MASPVDAARLGPSAADLVALISGATDATAAVKKARAEGDASSKKAGSNNAALLTKIWESLRPHVATLLVDEVGVRVLEALVRSNAAADDAIEETSVAHECIDAIIAAVEEAAVAAEAAAASRATPEAKDADSDDDDAEDEDENEDDEGRDALKQPLATSRVKDLCGLATHSTARRAVWAAIECGTKAQRKVLNRALAAEALNLATDRHGVHSLLLLLQHYPKSRATIVPALLPIVGSTLMADPTGAKTAVALVHPDSAADIAESLGNDEALLRTVSEEGMQFPWAGEQKRTVRFTTGLITNGLARQGKDDDVDTERRIAALNGIFQRVANRLVVLSVHQQGNFLVQALLRGLSSWAPNPAVDASLQHAVKVFSKSAEPSLAELATHHCGSHVVGALASCASTSVAGALRPHLLMLATEKHGSIALRRIIENATPQHAYGVADTLLKSLGQHTASVVRDEHGNLLIQAVLKALKPADRTRFFDAHIKAEAVELSMHPSGSHVVHALVSGGDAAMESASLTAFFGCVKKHLVELATHVNGRFIVEALIGPYREAQQALADNFATLAIAKGAQQVIVKLYTVASVSVKEQIVAYIHNHFASLAVQQQGSLTLQKLMQSERENDTASSKKSITESVKGQLKAQPALADRLRTDFFGRFVVQLAEGGVIAPQAPRSASAPSRPPHHAGAHSEEGWRRDGGGFSAGGRGGRGGGGSFGRGRGGGRGGSSFGGRGGAPRGRY